MADEHFDVLIVGAGLSGIGAGWHLQDQSPDRSYVILEGREAIGGTWDLFRYPGIRSDSDMYTLGYSFRPWTEAKAIADGPSILKYVRETARDYGIDQHIRYGHQVTAAAWSSEDALWTITARRGDGTSVRVTANFVFLCGGYYSYEGGYTPDFPGAETFKGTISIHPREMAGRPRLRGQAGRGDRLWARPAVTNWCRPWPARRRTSPCCSARPPTSSRGRRKTPWPTSCARCCRRSSPIT